MYACSRLTLWNDCDTFGCMKVCMSKLLSGRALVAITSDPGFNSWWLSGNSLFQAALGCEWCMLVAMTKSHRSCLGSYSRRMGGTSTVTCAHCNYQVSLPFLRFSHWHTPTDSHIRSFSFPYLGTA